MRTIGKFAYGLHILNHSLLGGRDQRLSTGGVETPPDKLGVRRLSEFEKGQLLSGSNSVCAFVNKVEEPKRYISPSERKVAQTLI